MKIKMTPRGQETVLGRGGCNNDCLLVLQWIRLWLSNASPSRRHRNSSCVGPFKIFRIITLVTQKGKGKVCPSQRLWWEESMTSSIFLPQGTGGQRLTGINSCPLISQPVRCLVVSQPFVPLLWEPLVIVSKSSYRIYISLPSCFCSALCASLYITTFLQYNGLHLSVPSVDTWHCVFDSFLFSSLLGLWCCPLPQSCVTIGALCRKILGAKVICLSHWHGRYPEWWVVCLPQGQTSHSPRHVGHKRSCKCRRSAFRLAHCFWKHRKHHVTLQYIVTEKKGVVPGESCLKKPCFF